MKKKNSQASWLGGQSAKKRKKKLGANKFRKSMSDLAVLRWKKVQEAKDLQNRHPVAE